MTHEKEIMNKVLTVVSRLCNLQLRFSQAIQHGRHAGNYRDMHQTGTANICAGSKTSSTVPDCCPNND